MHRVQTPEKRTARVTALYDIVITINVSINQVSIVLQ